MTHDENPADPRREDDDFGPPSLARVALGVLRLGATFAAIAGSLATLVVAVLWVVFGIHESDDPFFPIIVATAWSGMVGTAFAALLAVAARRLPLEKLTIPKVAGVGALGGALVWCVFGAFGVWAELHPSEVLLVTGVLAGLGAGFGSASLAIARKAAPVLIGHEEPRQLRDG